MRKEEIELDEYNTKSSKVIVTKDNKPIAIYSDLKSAQKDYHGKDGHSIGMRSHSAAERIRKANPGIKIVESVEEDIDEALTVQQRLKRARDLRKNKAKIALGRRRAARRMASMDVLRRRARKAAYKSLYNKITKNIPKDQLSPARKAEIEKRLEKPALQARIDRMARKMLKDVRKKELERKRGGSEKE